MNFQYLYAPLIERKLEVKMEIFKNQKQQYLMWNPISNSIIHPLSINKFPSKWRRSCFPVFQVRANKKKC